MSETTIAGRMNTIRAQIAAACALSKRDPQSVTLIAVSKTHPAERVIEAAHAGITHFGENRVEESAKIALANAAVPGLTWHMIGHVQSRKAEDITATYDWVHSVDSLKIAERYARFAAARGKTLPILLEINISGEASKEGYAAHGWQVDAKVRTALWDAVRGIVALPNLQVRGLMTVAPIANDSEQVRPVFRALRELRDALAMEFPGAAWDTLSMGMTDDYAVAIEEGATMIRIGRAIFGERGAL